MRFIALFAALVSSTAFATDFTFTYFGRDVGSVTYYNCDSVESIVEGHLEALGATSIRVRCTGGIENWGGTWRAMPVRVRASFNSPVATGNGEHTVLLNSRAGRNTGCGFNTALLDRLLPVVENVRVVSREARCNGEQGRWAYHVEVAN